MYNPKIHHRKSIRLKEYDYTIPNWYYVTICTHNKENLFGSIINNKMELNKYGIIVNEEWLKTKEIRKNIDLDYYVIMPNHIHGIIIIQYAENQNVRATRWVAPNEKLIVPQNDSVIQSDTKEKGASHRLTPTIQSNSLGSIIGQFKSVCTKRINKIDVVNKKFIWQRNYYEHIIRNDDDLYRIRKYIELNPLKWQLDEYY